MESARDIPVAYDVDVLVVGGSIGAVSAAVEAAKAGARVFLAAPRPYLGEDVAATYRLWLEPGEEPASDLAKAVFKEPAHGTGRSAAGMQMPPTPMQVKRSLDEALLNAGVAFLYGCFPTDMLKDKSGKLVGIVMANRSGRQAVKAKVIIDATPRATAARLAGAAFAPYSSGPQVFTRVVIGADIHEGQGIRGRKLPTRIQVESGQSPEACINAIEYTLRLDMPDGSFGSYARAEQTARDLTWDPGQVAASDVLFQVPPDPVKAQRLVEGPWPGAWNVDLDAFRPAKEERLYVLGGCAAVSREAAASLLRPLALMDVGARVGRAAAEEALSLGLSKGARVAVDARRGKNVGEVREFLNGVRPVDTGLPGVPSAKHSLPILGEYDVVVVGGGTGGAPAGIAAARQGAKTLVVEYLDGLGGVGTLGLIGKYYYGYLGGFTAEIDKGVAAMDGKEHPVSTSWNVEWKMEWYRRELCKAGADIWFGAVGCGALVQDGRVVGVVVATPVGRGVALAKAVVDATGNADIAASAGATCIYTDGSHVAVQGTGMPPRAPGANYTNIDYTITDDCDLVDVWRTFLAGRNKYKEAFDLAQIVDSRERRRIAGDFVISPLDVWNQRTYPDTVAQAQSNFDTHGYTIHPLFALQDPGKERITAFIPYSALLPKGLDGILVIGLGVSAHRDAMPILRMQADIQNQGYAAGVAAAMAAKAGRGARAVDLKELQKHLVAVGCLPEHVLTDADSYPLPEDQVAAAVRTMVNRYEGVEILLTQPDTALPLLRAAYTAASAEEHKLAYAHVLAMLGDSTGVDTLVAAVESRPWDQGWTYAGMGQFGTSTSFVDSLIMALGQTHDSRALEPVLKKAADLDAKSAFSHHRAVAEALEAFGFPEGAPVLVALLRKPGIAGHALTDIAKAKVAATESNPNANRDRSIRELLLARALYRCGDCEGIGERTLREYMRDLRGHLARHAQAVLNAK